MQDELVKTIDTPVLKWWVIIDEVILFGGFVEE
jgi:hypothetical protein